MGSFPSSGALATAKALNSTQVMDAILADLGAAGAGAGGANLVVNGDQWWSQRGSGPFTAHNAYAADRWQIQLAGGSALSVSTLIETGTPSSQSPRPAREHSNFAYTHAGSGSAQYRQKVEFPQRYRGLWLSMSALVAADTANMARLFLDDGVSLTTGAFHTGGGSVQRLTVAKQVGAAASALYGGLQLSGASGAGGMTAFMLVMAAEAVDYIPQQHTAEWAMIERFYEQKTDLFIDGGVAAAGGVTRTLFVPFRVQKGGAPTVTKLGTWGVVNATQPTIVASSAQGFRIQTTSVAAGAFSAATDSADDVVTAEWNP